ncbi:hypothetical protein SAMN04488515_2305 [Cognatiyoonia koreensis]|uniref:Uncharacterized protein n=1 Tax=Cognatiyoonia koreensis TaxID=364200 RepID=A0A1I0QXM0_9RHOB|nr:hypothetical protein [Cognatiyoonia koreensis]SEW32325.1 hypothetical protein SAMN04488515_2305 [Cognatiyoonia koreensis]
MFTPLIDSLLHLSAAFVLGMALGFAIWKLGAKQQINAAKSEMDFWRKRLDQERIARDDDQKKIEALEHDRTVLKKHISAQAS